MSYKRFNNQQDFETWLESREPLANARFGADFPVKDEHVKAIVAASGDKLISLYLGDSDTGNGTWVKDAAVLAIAQGCPNLRELALCSCTSVTTAAFAAVIEACPHLEVLHCTGHDRRSGQLTGKALDQIIKGQLPALRELYLTDQTGIPYNKVQQLLKKRRHLCVQAGETDSDSAAWGCVLAAQGRSYGDGLYGRW